MPDRSGSQLPTLSWGVRDTDGQMPLPYYGEPDGGVNGSAAKAKNLGKTVVFACGWGVTRPGWRPLLAMLEAPEPTRIPGNRRTSEAVKALKQVEL